MVYAAGKQSHTTSSDEMVEHLVKLVEEKLAQNALAESEAV
jgi:hypothetical protein